MEKLNILVLGGCGFIGRNLISYLVNKEVASYIRIIDKVPPQVAWLNDLHKQHFENDIVEFRSANLINPESCKAAFHPPECGYWDIVVNCAGETKPGQTDPVYKEGILKLSINCANEAALHNVRHYIELSSGNMYSDDKVPHKEDGPLEPWTYIAKWKEQVEKELANIPNLRYTILRLPIVYGLGDKTGLLPRIMLSAIYKHLGKTMKVLWNSDMKINTVHVEDVCSAIYFLSTREDTIQQIYNVVDDADSTQGSIFSILGDMFNINIDYYGNVVSFVLDLEEVADEANDIHLRPWAEACRKDNIQNTPLSPHMDREHLLHKQLHLDGSKLKRLGFTLNIPRPTSQHLKQIIDDYVTMKVFPSSLSP